MPGKMSKTMKPDSHSLLFEERVCLCRVNKFGWNISQNEILGVKEL